MCQADLHLAVRFEVLEAHNQRRIGVTVHRAAAQLGRIGHRGQRPTMLCRNRTDVTVHPVVELAVVLLG